MINIIGVDPGGTTGVARLTYTPAAGYVALDAFEVPSKDDLIGVLEERYGRLFDARLERVRFAVEDFVVSARAGRSRSATAGALARKYIGQLELLAMNTDSSFAKRPAAAVKPWAIDARLAKIAHVSDDLQTTQTAIELTVGLPHARDALRHALFEARRAMEWPDPLSRAYSS